MSSSRKRSACAGSPIRLSDARTRVPSSRRRFCSNISRSGGPASLTRSTPTAAIARLRTPVDSSASSGMRALPSSAVPTLPSAVAAAARTSGSGSWRAATRSRETLEPPRMPIANADVHAHVLLLVPQRAGEASVRRRVHRGVGRDRRAVVLVGEGLEETVDRPAPLAVAVDLDQSPRWPRRGWPGRRPAATSRARARAEVSRRRRSASTTSSRTRGSGSRTSAESGATASRRRRLAERLGGVLRACEPSGS